ncbi:hypothetical protein [uncultured Pseudodesulfovibrio sp.]|uniref:hypothetical protein n=1 Tax=uncultured Pseudodesulfovibrio sp. TaxID=2035858 RepID=UPI0029C732F6|nr:hypothetical protein [uncultured Pseudodesulfovibrio sp.]
MTDLFGGIGGERTGNVPKGGEEAFLEALRHSKKYNPAISDRKNGVLPFAKKHAV